jgi:hypothetical protein
VKFKFKPWMLLIPVALLLFVLRNRIFGAFASSADPKSAPANIVPLPAAPSGGGGGGSSVGGGSGEEEPDIPTTDQLKNFLEEAVGTEVDTPRGDRFNRRQKRRLENLLKRAENFNETHGGN